MVQLPWVRAAAVVLDIPQMRKHCRRALTSWVTRQTVVAVAYLSCATCFRSARWLSSPQELTPAPASCFFSRRQQQRTSARPRELNSLLQIPSLRNVYSRPVTANLARYVAISWRDKRRFAVVHPSPTLKSFAYCSQWVNFLAAIMGIGGAGHCFHPFTNLPCPLGNCTEPKIDLTGQRKTLQH